MTIRLLWREKVVLSILLMCFIVFNGSGQDHPVARDTSPKKITLTGRALPFEEILRQLSVQTKLYFIYSSNAVGFNKPVSVNFHQRPLAEVFKELEDLMNITFRKEGNYIIVKKGVIAKNVAEISMLANSKQTYSRNITSFASANSSLRAEPLMPDSRQRHTSEYPFSIPYQTLQKNLVHCPSDLFVIDTASFKKYSLLKVTNPRPARQLFTSVRLIANEYSGGIEIHAGIPSLYAVINGGVMTEGYFRYGYGLGTSIPVKSKLTFKPIYTFATLRQRQDYIIDKNVNLVIPDGLKLTARHHQVKFIFEYKLSSRIQIHAGPTFNFLKTLYSFERPKVLFYDMYSSGVGAGSGPNQSYPAPSLRTIRSAYYVSAPSDGFSLKAWTGFEAGISYLIKFPHR